ncbi:hypothetical protein A9Z07_13225 [Acinetobacter sp. YK3]|nr:hypothetical protein A9Z07_13225 [Acinetobacter sp. YK3]
MKHIWFVTGTIRGMGVEIVKAAIQQGDSVIGAGLAGLKATTELKKVGKKVLLLEARDRIGG